MYRPLAFVAFLVSMPVIRVSACEGECIVAITDAVLGNYTTPLNIALTKMADSIVSQIMPNKNYGGTPLSLLSPIISEYNKRSYDYMENAVFKSYFHGKCQNPDTGIDPSGCPNPDCPVVCGTPGSIVHFFSKFREIAFDATVGLIDDLTNDGSSTYKQVEKSVMSAASSNTRRRSLRFMRGSGAFGKSSGRLTQNNKTTIKKREDNIKSELRNILRQFRSFLLVACGGTAEGKTNDLPNCSWEQAFKQFILTFP